MKVYLARPRGFCAGVDRAIEIVERALEVYGPPIYVRHEIVHNDHVVERLRAQGAIFLDNLDEIPKGAITIFSAHGVSPEVRQEAKERNLKVIDATCPLVTKVHLEAIRFAKKGYKILLIGHRNHVEVIGTLGEAPEAITVVESIEEVENLEIDNPQKLVYITQTTLSIDDTRNIVEALKAKFPHLESPPKDDICYATTNRQHAVKDFTQYCDLVLVLGSKTSSNSNRLVEVAQSRNTDALLINDASDLNHQLFDGKEHIGITAGASAPEDLVQNVVEWLDKHFQVELGHGPEIHENVQFNLPKELKDRTQRHPNPMTGVPS